MGADTNPFATRFIRPGAVTWTSTRTADELRTLVDTLGRGGSWQVVGPHGSGKTTLLRHLATELERSGRRAATTRSPREAIGGALRPYAVILADEVESWPMGALALLRTLCRLRRLTLVVSCHRDLGMPTLHTRTVDTDLVARIVEQLAGPRFVERERLGALLQRHGGDLRELLFSLYDEYEDRCRKRSALQEVAAGETTRSSSARTRS